jgi:FAD/FMN-containing dehydrogenase
MRTRREFLNSTVQVGTGLALLPYASDVAVAQDAGVLVNDIHSQLNETRVAGVIVVDSEEALGRAITAARREGKAVSIAGGRHAMGGQQFATGSMLIDTRPMRGGLRLDADRGVVDVHAGIQWPELVEGLLSLQKDQGRQWGIFQKQTGADRLSLGGALGANIHGRGLRPCPIGCHSSLFLRLPAERDG